MLNSRVGLGAPVAGLAAPTVGRGLRELAPLAGGPSLRYLCGAAALVQRQFPAGLAEARRGAEPGPAP